MVVSPRFTVQIFNDDSAFNQFSNAAVGLYVATNKQRRISTSTGKV
jgi:hypothetical protein